MTGSSETKSEFHCPGQIAPVSQAVHRARLAALYPACRGCEHRSDLGGLSPKRAERLAEVYAGLPPCPALFDDEGIRGVLVNELTPAAARRAGAAFGLYLREQDVKADWPRVVLAGDGRRLTHALVAAAADGLRLAGCHVTDAGRATSGCLSFALSQSGAEGGLLVGNPGRKSQEVGLRFWRGTTPVSRPGGLERIETLFHGGLDRPTRQSGSLRRESFKTEYLQSLVERDENGDRLRRLPDRGPATAVSGDGACPLLGAGPLRVEVDSAGGVLTDYLRWPQKGTGTVAGNQTGGGHVGKTTEPVPFCWSRGCRFYCDSTRNTSIEGRVLEYQAHFGVETDGDAEICSVFDEGGRAVDAERLLLVLAAWFVDHPGDDADDATAPAVILEHDATAETQRALAEMGYRVVRAEARRAAMHRAMAAEGAVLGGGPSGRVWRPRPGYISADAMVALGLVLTILGHIGRPLSEVVSAVAT